VTFNLEEWPLATAIEIVDKNLKFGNEVVWLDFFGKFRDEKEFPLADYVQKLDHRYKLYKSNLISLLSNKNGKFYYSHHTVPYNSQMVPPQELIDEVAYLELISRKRESFPCVKNNAKLQEKFKSIFKKTYSFFFDYLKENNFDKIYIYNGRFIQERALWEACKRLDKTVIFYEKFGPDWVNRYFEFKMLVHSPAYRSSEMLAFAKNSSLDLSSEKTDIAKSWFNNRILGISQGFTKLQISGQSLEDFKPYIVFFHSSEDELITTDLRNIFWLEQLETVKKLSETIIKINSHKLVIRLHPNLRYKSDKEQKIWHEFTKKLSDASKLISVISPESTINSYDLIKASEGVVTVGSTIGVEAAYLRKKSILLGRAFHESMGIVKTVNGIEELAIELESLNAGDVDSAYINALKYGFFMSSAGTIFNSIETRQINGHEYYQIYKFRIRKPLLVRFLMRFDSALKRFQTILEAGMGRCKDDCRFDSGARRK
jgi:hypothetical protein